MKSRILAMLRHSDGYVSGQQLCETLGVSRTAVWKVIEQLKDEGYKIEAVRSRGYHLEESPDVMSRAEIESLMETSWAGRNVLYFDTVDSTNIQAKKQGDEAAPHGTLVVADQQNAGKGRRGRSWDSVSGTGIYMTILLRPNKSNLSPNKAPMLTLVMALSVAQAVIEGTGLLAKIKWPNDVVVNGKKVCGILTEMSAEVDYINHVVIGVGINVNQESFPMEISETATSLRIEADGNENVFRRPELIVLVMKHFEINYETFLQTEDLSKLQEAYNELLVNRDADVRVLEPGNEYNGHAAGINSTGELLVEKEDGSLAEIFAGEVSVRGIYGYV